MSGVGLLDKSLSASFISVLAVCSLAVSRTDTIVLTAVSNTSSPRVSICSFTIFQPIPLAIKYSLISLINISLSFVKFLNDYFNDVTSTLSSLTMMPKRTLLSNGFSNGFSNGATWRTFANAGGITAIKK